MGSPEINNRKASHDYHILETVEAGVQLCGTEVKSLRGGQGNLNDAFARIEKGECFLYQFHISPYEKAHQANHEPMRVRKLLLHRAEIYRLSSDVVTGGKTLVALKGYFKDRHFKVLLGLASGKNHRDKRHDIMKRDVDRQIRRTMANQRKK